MNLLNFGNNPIEMYCTIEVIGHHTCKYEGTLKEIISKVPFRSISQPHYGYHPFLGEGYYFWDDNLEMAKIFGKTHYKGNYVIVEFQLLIDFFRMFDLVGNRQHLKIINEVISRMRKSNYPNKITVSMALAFLKRHMHSWNFNIIKAIDASFSRDDDKLSFRNKKEFINLNPKIFYCFTDWSDKYFKEKKIVYYTKNQQG